MDDLNLDSFLIMGDTAAHGIVYADVEPDFSLTAQCPFHKNFFLDISNDSIADFLFKVAAITLNWPYRIQS